MNARGEIGPDDTLVYIRLQIDAAPSELIICNPAGAWTWFDVYYCRREQKFYLVQTGIGEPERIPVVCPDGELLAAYWAHPELVPADRIEVLAGGPCAHLQVLPLYLQGKGFQQFCAAAGYAIEMVYCALCQDMLPINGQIPEHMQEPCLHIRWCAACGMFSTPNYPGKHGMEEHCPHRSKDDRYALMVNQHPNT